MTKILGGVTVAMAIAMAFMWRANASLNERLGAAELSIQQAELANQSNLGTIGILRTELNVCVAERTVDEQQNAVVVAQLERDLEEASEREVEVQIIREEIFRDPSCAELGALDIGAACPALVSSLFDRADSLN